MWLKELVFVTDLKVWRLLRKKSSESWKLVLWCWWVIIKWIKDPKQWVKVKRKNLWCIKLSVGSHMDTYEPLDRPVRMIIISNKFLWKQSCFPKSSCASERKIYKTRLLSRFPDKIQLENYSTMSGQEVFMHGLYELCTGAKSCSISDVFISTYFVYIFSCSLF